MYDYNYFIKRMCNIIHGHEIKLAKNLQNKLANVVKKMICIIAKQTGYIATQMNSKHAKEIHVLLFNGFFR